jgi:hypothetical protein
VPRLRRSLEAKGLNFCKGSSFQAHENIDVVLRNHDLVVDVRYLFVVNILTLLLLPRAS